MMASTKDGTAQSDALTENLIHLLQSQLQMNQQQTLGAKSWQNQSPDNNNNDTTPPDTKLASFEEALHEEEQAVLREALYILQGVSEERIKFDTKTETIIVNSPALTTQYLSRTSSTLGSYDALMICGEAGWRFRRIQAFIEKPTESVIVRALQRVTEEQYLQSYLAYLTQLEQSSPSSLRQILRETQPIRQTLESLAIVLDGVQDVQGAHVLTDLVKYSRHGDSRHVHIVETLLQASSVPWLDMLYQWVTKGTLLSKEFFVSQTSGVETKLLWRDGFKLHRDKVPAILQAELAEPSFQIGKGINFIRRVLQDGTWKMELDDQQESILQASEAQTTPSNSRALSMRQVKRTIQQAVQLVHSHILTTLKNDHALMSHMFALKQFLLLGQGDFYSALMDGLHAEYGFDGTDAVLYRYNVVSIVDTALNNTNASDFDDKILQRLQVKLLYADNDDSKFKFGQTQQAGNTVWELICLEYTLPDPLIAVVDSNCMAVYHKLFLYLFGVKKVEYQLNVTWRQSAMLQHSLQLLAQYNAITVKNNPAYAQANILLRHIAMTRQAMSHFVINLKSYLFFEVLEGGWKTLVRVMDEAKTLDEVVHAHSEFLKSTERKSMLPVEAISKSTADSAAMSLVVSNESLNAQVHVLLQLARRFCEYQHRIFSSALEAADRANERRKEAEKRADHGDWGFLMDAETLEMETFFGLSDTSKLDELNDTSNAFHEQIEMFIRSIDRKLHGGSSFAAATVDKKARQQEDSLDEDRDDLDSLRFLKFQLGSNGFYNTVATVQ